MPLFRGKKSNDASRGKPAAGKKSKGEGPPLMGKGAFVQEMIDEWEETDERLAQLPLEDWDSMKEVILEVTDRLYDIQKYPDDYNKDFIMDFKNNHFVPMLKGAKDIVKESTLRILSEVDSRADSLNEWKYCEEFLVRRRQAVKGVHKVEEYIEEGKACSQLLETEGLLLSDDEIMEQFDILERVLNKVRPLVDKADLKDYVTLRNMDEKFIEGCNKSIKKLQAREFSEWSHFKPDVDVLQECMVRMKKKFKTKEEADSHIEEMKAALKVVKKHIKNLEKSEGGEEEDAADKKGKNKTKSAPAKKKGATEKKKEPAKKGGWLSRKMGK
ncbi:unnamed protein product [Cylindrotheca closterium]|uniref:Uncharacterized protein n=1 Tax=Cylindrotheca closterium TaxID=2856 RepID=A0AAD2FFF2_9STRA|nr:unnamed protein product [Cylindrotheca closterium]